MVSRGGFAASLPIVSACPVEDKGETSASISVGDLNADGLLDIGLAKGRHWPLQSRVLMNDGREGFCASNLGTVPARTYSAALADVDGDGHLHVVVSNDAPNRKLVYRNDGKGHLTEIGTFGEPGWTTWYVTLADHRDGFPDIVAANRGDFPDIGAADAGAKSNPVPSFACVNNGKGGFPTCQPLPTESATSIVAADFDRDGAIDLFAASRWWPEHYLMERWQGPFPHVDQGRTKSHLDPDRRGRRFRW